jgi:asparagine synthase (glutamine-hydrolysing)
MQSPEFALRLAAHGHVVRALRDLHGWAKLDRGSPARLLSRLALNERGPSPR